MNNPLQPPTDDEPDMAWTVWTDEDSHAWNELLLHEQLADGPLPEMVEGYVTGTVISPFDGLADELLTPFLVLFDIHLAQLDPQLGDSLVALTQKRMDAILDGLDQDLAADADVQAKEAAPRPDVYDPLLADWDRARDATRDDPTLSAEEKAQQLAGLPRNAEPWARGMAVARQMWENGCWDLLDKEARKQVGKLYQPIAKLSQRGPGEVTDTARRLALLDQAHAAVYELYDLSQAYIELMALTPAPITKVQTPGRNDPCSCGSGKKYKKCCGA